MGPDENKNNFNGGVNLNPPNSMAPNSTPILTTTSTSSQSSALNPTLAPTPNPALDPTPNPRAQFTAGNRLGMRQSRKFSAKEELNRISNDLNLNSANVAPAGANDVAFGGAKPKASSTKKPLIFALIGVTVVAVAGLIAILALKPNEKMASSGDPLRDKFNLFANYVLYGEESAADIKDENYEIGNTYYLGELKYKDGNENEKRQTLEQYFIKASEKFSSFYDEYQKSGRTELEQLLAAYPDKLDLMHYETIAPTAGSSEILRLYSSRSNYQEFLDNYYKPYQASQKQNTKNYIKNYRVKVDGFINLLSRYKQFNCLDAANETITNFCLSNKIAGFVSMRKEYYAYLDYFSEMARRKDKQSYAVFGSIWKINEELYGKQ